MQIARTSRVIRWAYLFEKNVPLQTSICPLFWRTVLFTPVFKLAAPLGFVLFLLSRFWFWPGRSVSVTIITIAVLGFTEWLVRREKRRQFEDWARPREPKPPSVIRLGVRALKAKVCPIVQIR